MSRTAAIPTAVVERTLSEFLRSSGEVLREAEDRDVLLRRRDGSDLMLVRAEREETVREAIGLSANLMDWLARECGHEFIAVLPRVLPWMNVLPEDDRELFGRELVETLGACASLGSYGELGVLLNQWKNTAYAWSRPELADAFRTDRGGAYDEPVPAPGG